jgi:hypothetical protein
MSRALRAIRATRAAVTGAATLMAGGLLMAMLGAASAATHVHARYRVTGSTFIKAPNFTLRIVRLSVAGVNVPVGDSCQTSSSVVVTVKSQKGFNILNGGNLAGSYTIGQFQHCELATLLINATIPASGNTIALKLGKAKLA